MSSSEPGEDSPLAATARLRPAVPPGLPRGARPMIAVVEARPGHADDLRAAVLALTAGCRAEPGCIQFTPYEDALRPGRFHMVETYASTDAFERHLATAHVEQFWVALLDFSTNRDASNLTQLVELQTGP